MLMHGTYISVEPFHPFRYLDEQVFRYNNRATKKKFVSDSSRFEMALPQIADKRITYDELIGRRFEQPRWKRPRCFKPRQNRGKYRIRRSDFERF